jgi:hypothetical protein
LADGEAAATGLLASARPMAAAAAKLIAAVVVL